MMPKQMAWTFRQYLSGTAASGRTSEKFAELVNINPASL
jgi:hypothetical protein